MGPGSPLTSSKGNPSVTKEHLVCLKVVEVCQSSRLPYVSGEINGKSANILVDTGAEVTLVDEGLIKDTGAVISDTHRYITGVTGAALNIVGEAILVFGSEIHDEGYDNGY